MLNIRIFVNIALVISLYFLSYYIYLGISNPIPTLGDDWDYHIPISRSILDGSFISPPQHTYFARYYPGSSEAINSILLLLDIPLALSSIIAIIALFYACYYLSITFRLKKELSMLYAASFCTLTVILRWANKVSIDAWLTVFFIYSIILLEKPRKTIAYFLLLGFACGMLIGTKYTGVIYFVLLFIIFIKKLWTYIDFKRILAFILTFSIFGLFWYFRNYYATGSIMPYCLNTQPCPNPGSILFLWEELISHPLIILDSLFGEYKLWSFAPIILIIFFFSNKSKGSFPYGFITLTIIGLLNLIFYFTLPTSKEPWQTVSTMRYLLPAYAPMILAVFILFQKFKKETILGYIVIANMLPTLSMAYYPKLVLIYLTISLLLIYLMDKRNSPPIAEIHKSKM